jgi:hypothetical protein
MKKLEVVLKDGRGCYKQFCLVCHQVFEMVYVSADVIYTDDDGKSKLIGEVCPTCLASGVSGMHERIQKLKEDIEFIDKHLDTIESLPSLSELELMQAAIDKEISEEMERDDISIINFGKAAPDGEEIPF